MHYHQPRRVTSPAESQAPQGRSLLAGGASPRTHCARIHQPRRGDRNHSTRCDVSTPRASAENLTHPTLHAGLSRGRTPQTPNPGRIVVRRKAPVQRSSRRVAPSRARKEAGSQRARPSRARKEAGSRDASDRRNPAPSRRAQSRVGLDLPSVWFARRIRCDAAPSSYWGLVVLLHRGPTRAGGS